MASRWLWRSGQSFYNLIHTLRNTFNLVLLLNHVNRGPVGLWLSQKAGGGDDLSHEVREVVTDCGFPTGACSLSPLVSTICVRTCVGRQTPKDLEENPILFQLLRKGFLEAENHPDDGAREAREP